jgi:hypothetical protein
VIAQRYYCRHLVLEALQPAGEAVRHLTYGVNRTLHVDSVAVAKDTPAGLIDSGGGLCIACGSQKEVGSFWSGLIDDVRIYNRLVRS